MIVSTVRNVNTALVNLRALAADRGMWRTIAPRGNTTIELRSPHTTCYIQPQERVLFGEVRDANPFFHIMEALWIMAGRSDVAFLTRFNKQMAKFSDNGKDFHAPYGDRLRRWGAGGYLDQITQVIGLLEREPDTRRAVMSIWDPALDLSTVSKDIPCNDLITLKLRENELDMSVMCRSNDAILGAYGANAVQFSFIQEFIARALKAEVGRYRQISDSFHIYINEDVWKRLIDSRPAVDAYEILGVEPYPVMDAATHYTEWLKQCEMFCAGCLNEYKKDVDPFFTNVAGPILAAWGCYKEDTTGLGISKNIRIDAALECLEDCAAADWRLACGQWLSRRRVE